MTPLTKKSVTQLSYDIIGCAIKVHRALGPGLLESIYEKCLIYELELKGFIVRRQFKVPIIYDNHIMDSELRVDLWVNNCIVVELKTVEKLLPVHQAQLLTYMKLLKVPQGLLINFYTDNISRSMIPLVNDLFEELPEG